MTRRPRTTPRASRYGHYAYGLALLLGLLLTLALWRELRTVGHRWFGDFFYPYLRVARSVSGTLSDRTLLLNSRLELAERVESLERENQLLAAQARSAGTLLEENTRLRRLLQLPPRPGWRFIPAEIILRDPEFWDELLTVDRGSDSGVEPGAAVLAITADGRPVLLGVIDQVGKHTSTVVTVFHPELRLSVRLPRSGRVGVLNALGRRLGSRELPLGFLPTRGDYTVAEPVETTGFERLIPAGLKIGNLASFDDVDSIFASTPYREATVTPELEPNTLRFLLIAERGEAGR